MQVKTLQWKRVTRMALVVLMLSIIGTTTANTHHDEYLNDDLERATNYDFGKACPTGQTLYYKITNATNHYVSIVPLSTFSPTEPYGNNPPTGNITFPETVEHNGTIYTVTAIGNNAFSGCDGLTGDLVIPNTVTSIGSNAFFLCSGFNGTLTLSDALTSIEGYAFNGCSNLHGDLVIPEGITTIKGSTFAQCTHLTGTLTLPSNLYKIGSNAFNNCGFTGSLVLPNTVNYIGNFAFAGCSGFTGDLIIPNFPNPSNDCRLGQSAFQDCSGFNGDLVIPANVPLLLPSVFAGCSHIQEIYLYSENPPASSSSATPDNVFSGISGATLYVPNTANYSSWGYFTNKQQRNFFINGDDANWNNPNNWISNMGGNAVIVADCEMNSSSANVTSLTIISRYNISIKPGCTLTVSNAINNKGTAANLIIEDGGQLMHHQNGILATIQKNINAYSTDNDGWYLISTSLAGNTNITAVENLLSNNYDLYYYDEPTYYWINQEQTDNGFTVLESGKGYLYSNSEAVTLGFAGTLNNGNQTVTIDQLSYQGEYLKGFNLIGNPYAHNVTSLELVNVADQGCYRLNGTADLIVSEVSAEDPLKPAEGIFVLATGENASVTFNTNTAKTRTETVKTGSICMEVLENGKISDRLLVKRNEGSDFQKISFRDNRTKLFATRDNEELAIVVSNDNEQAINFKSAKNSIYTISVTLKDIDVDYLHLIDNLTGNNVDLLANPTYTFEARTTDYASRFRLVFSPEAIENGNNESFAFVANGEFVIANEGMATLQVIDLNGRILSTETINGSFNMPINLSSGVYMLRLINGNDVKTQKIVVE